MKNLAIKTENLGKKYFIGHNSKEIGYTSLREQISKSTIKVFKNAFNVFRGKPIILGDTIEEFWALKNLNFEIIQGDVVGIIGRNGAGKSTLLKLLSRITGPTTGTIKINGRVASLLEVGTGFHPELTGRENIYLNGSILGASIREINKKFDEIVNFAGVERFLDTPVKRYSSGMYVRLAFSIPAHLEPDILIIDEVLAVGDMEFQKKCLGKMEISAKDGRTVIFVSHNLPMISSLCKKCILLDEGKILKQDITNKVISFYQKGPNTNPGVFDFSIKNKVCGDELVILKKAWIGDINHNTKTEFNLEDEIDIFISFEILKTLNNFPIPNLQIIDDKGNCVFSTSLISQQRKIISPNHFITSCKIPGNFLNSGYFSIHLILNHNEKSLITAWYEKYALSFNVVDNIYNNQDRKLSGWSGKWPGSVRPKLAWEITKGE